MQAQTVISKSGPMRKLNSRERSDLMNSVRRRNERTFVCLRTGETPGEVITYEEIKYCHPSDAEFESTDCTVIEDIDQPPPRPQSPIPPPARAEWKYRTTASTWKQGEWGEESDRRGRNVITCVYQWYGLCRLPETNALVLLSRCFQMDQLKFWWMNVTRH